MSVQIQTIYDYLDNCCSWDEDDLRPPNLHGQPTKEPSWRRNIRNVLKSDTDKGVLENKQRGEYVWNISADPPLWAYIIMDALEKLGGEATNPRLYSEIEKVRPRELTDSWKMTVQGTIERHSRDSDAWGGNIDVFYSVKGMGSGVWGIRDEYRVRDLGSTQKGRGVERSDEYMFIAYYVARTQRKSGTLPPLVSKYFQFKYLKQFYQCCFLNVEKIRSHYIEKYGDEERGFSSFYNSVGGTVQEFWSRLPKPEGISGDLDNWNHQHSSVHAVWGLSGDYELYDELMRIIVSRC